MSLVADTNFWTSAGHLFEITRAWLAVHTGSANTPGAPKNYNFWSGSGSDLGEITLVGAVLGLFYKHNCHKKGCPRIGKHQVDGTPWCNKHHQTARDIRKV